jgi:hypothetical protein
VQEATAPVLTAWESFYVIVGSSAAALTGLMFVVITLIAESRRQWSSRGIDAFGTPTIVHFCAALLVSAIISAPWRTLGGVALTIGTAGVIGIPYVLIVLHRARGQTGYKPVLEDWIWHTVLPLVVYVTYFLSALFLVRRPEPSLFAIGAATLLTVFIGIHNAWDTVTFIVIDRQVEPNEPAAAAEATPAS